MTDIFSARWTLSLYRWGLASLYKNVFFPRVLMLMENLENHYFDMQQKLIKQDT
jgi:hypothetical protein